MKPHYILGAFGAICLLFALFFSGNRHEGEIKTFSGQGGLFGPITIIDKNAAYAITIKNTVALNHWSNINIEVLDAEKQRLFGFGDGMWSESGYDVDGRWSESKSQFTMKVTFKKPGDYYLDISAERNDGAGNNITVQVQGKRGSSIPFVLLGIVAVIAAVILNYFTQVVSPGTLIAAPILLGGGALLLILFIWALFSSMRGYGYMGYHGYHAGPSFFYFGSPRIYHQPNHRVGSLGGPSHRGGGLRSGGK